MNIAFTGTERNSGKILIEGQDGQMVVFYKQICRVNNEGTKDLDDCRDILDEFRYRRDKSKNNVLIIESSSKIEARDIPGMLKDFDGFMKNKFNPQGDSFKINGKPLEQSRNKLYIFEKLQTLSERIKSKRDIELAFVGDYLKTDECQANLLGENFYKGERLSAKEISACHCPSTVKLVADGCSKSFGNAIERLKSANPRFLRR